MALLHSSCCSTPRLLSFRNSTTSNSQFFSLRSQSLRFPQTRLALGVRTTVATESPVISDTESGGDSPKLLLEVKDLSAVIADSRQPILKGVNLSIHEGEVSISTLYLNSFAVLRSRVIISSFFNLFS